MVCASRSMISASSCPFASQSQQRTTLGHILYKPKRVKSGPFSIYASSDDSDCNTEECAPDKEVGKVSVEWLAGEKTKVVGTFPPRRRGWTGYVEKDTAGQTNIYSVEPVVYVAESAISSGNAGTSSEGSQNIAVIAAGLGLVSIAAASVILFQVSKNTPQVQSSDYSGPPLSYYINKFKPSNTIDASAPPESQSAPTVEASVPPEPQNPSEFKSESSEVVLSGVEEEFELVGTQS